MVGNYFETNDEVQKHGDLGGGSGCCFKVIFFPEGVNLSYSNAVC